MFFQLLNKGSFAIAGFPNKALRLLLPDKSAGQITRLLRRLRAHGLIRRVNKCYRYYLTDFGRHVSLMVLKLRNMVIIPAFAFESLP